MKSGTRSSNLSKLLSLMASVGAERIIPVLLCDAHYLPWTAATQLTAAPPENNNAFIISLKLVPAVKLSSVRSCWPAVIVEPRKL